ncbi:MAG: hypothetical protein BWY46_00310 [Firmicutes bacterium ADurb.Bin300]|nr:MAG: hypothetical protein BWY46_00310 [Firmicutes bacterium ADurb.Bin300]
MAKTWYPAIDYLACAEFGACTVKCTIVYMTRPKYLPLLLKYD